MTKGSGMIQPRMATTLGFVMTDANIPRPSYARMLMRATERSYNRISVDGDTSTNDTVIVLANGCFGRAARSEGNGGVRRRRRYRDAKRWRGRSRAMERARRKLVTIEVVGAATEDAAAAAIARAIANSPLVKTAIAGSDPNWGRILSAAGQCRRRTLIRRRSTSRCRA